MKKKEVKQKALPTGWREVRLGEIGKFSKGNGITKNEVMDKGIPCIRYGELYTKHNFRVQKFYSFISDKDINKRKLIKDNDLLFAGSGETRGEIGKCASFNHDGKAYAGGDVIVCSLNPKEIRADFASYYLNTIGRRQINRLGQGDSVVHIYSRYLEGVVIPLPPLPEQKAIASLLEKWDTAIEKTEALIAAKEKRFKWLLKTLISDQQDNPEWRKVRLGNLCTKILGGGTPSTANIGYWKGHIPWMTSADIVNAKTINTRKYITAQAVKDSATNLIPRNNIIVVTRVGIGKAVKNEMDICISQDSQGLILKKSVSADFLIHCLLEKIKVFKSVSQGSTIQGITKKRLFDIEFPLPSLPKQKQIAQHINIVEREIGLLTKLIEKYRTQKRGLMQRLLKGKWRMINQ